jgi:hypothetical protein
MVVGESRLYGGERGAEGALLAPGDLGSDWRGRSSAGTKIIRLGCTGGGDERREEGPDTCPA